MVQQLHRHRGPCLHLIWRQLRSHCVEVPSGLSGSALQAWVSSLLSQLSGGGPGSAPPDALVLIQPLQVPDQPSSTHGDGQYSNPAGCCIMSAAGLGGACPCRDDTCWQGDLAAANISGKIGQDCCDEESQQGSSLSVRADEASRRGSSGRGGGGAQGERQYGLVAQALSGCWSGQCDGCYLLQTSSNTEHAGCSCTYYTLTSLCKGPPLREQLMQAWLV